MIRRAIQPLADRVAARRETATLSRKLAEALATAAADPAHLVSRRCPVCDDSRIDEVPAVRGPIYPFHRCQRCSLLYTPAVLRPDAQRKFWDKHPVSREWWTRLYKDARANRERAVYTPLVARLAARAPGRGAAIDVGCHFGKLVAELKAVFGEVFGLELNPRTAKTGAQNHGVDIRTTPIERLDRPASSVDVITMNQILEHLTDVRPLLAGAHRLLKAKGVLYVGLPHAASIGMRLRGAAHSYVATHQHVNLFTAEPLARLAVDLGFRIAELRTDDTVDLSAADWAVARIPDRPPYLYAPAFAVDQVVRRVAAVGRIPSRLGVGAHLEAILIKE